MKKFIFFFPARGYADGFTVPFSVTIGTLAFFFLA